MSVPVTVTKALTEISLQTSTITATEAFTTTVFSIVTAAQTEKYTATETLVSLKTMTATAIVTEKAASMVPTTLISTMIFTEKMLPVTVYMTTTATQPGQMTTLVESLPVTTIQTERVTNTATATVSISCSATTVISSVQVPITLISTVTDARPMTLTQKNFITVTGGVMTTTYVSTTTQTTTITKGSSVPPMACPLQEKTVTRIITSTAIPPMTSIMITTKSVPLPFTSMIPITSTKVQVPTSSKASIGSICPTPTVSSSSKVMPTGSSGGCQEGQKRCDIYDRRSFNECKGGQWSTGVKLTEADSLQCEESSGTVKLVPIPASYFHV